VQLARGLVELAAPTLSKASESLRFPFRRPEGIVFLGSLHFLELVSCVLEKLPEVCDRGAPLCRETRPLLAEESDAPFEGGTQPELLEID
jgi:hypothetical protein